MQRRMLNMAPDGLRRTATNAQHGTGRLAPYRYDYATSSDSRLSNDLLAVDPGNNANFRDLNGYAAGPPYYSTEVGAFENSESPYGTHDQSGNMREWHETATRSHRGIRGGGFWSRLGSMSTADTSTTLPALEFRDLGFRVASLPEPGSLTLVVCGLGMLLLRRRRRKKSSRQTIRFA